MVDTSTRPAKGYMELVPDRTAATLLPIISAHVAPGTEVWSDQWASYNNVAALPGVVGHQTVNHSVQFITGIASLSVHKVAGCFFRNWSAHKHNRKLLEQV